MKRLLLGAIALLALPAYGPAYGSATLVQNNIASTNVATGMTATLSLASPVTAGHVMFVYLQNYPQATTATIADNVGDTFTACGGVFPLLITSGRLNCWYTMSAVGGSTTVTATFSTSGAYYVMAIAEFAATAAVTMDQKAAATGTTAVLSSGPTANVTGSDELVLGFGGNEQNNYSFTAGDGFTLIGQASGGGQSGAMEYESAAPAAGSYTCAMTMAGPLSTGMGCVTLKIGSGAAAVRHRMARVD